MINRVEFHRTVHRHTEYEKQVVQKTVVDKVVHETQKIKEIEERVQRQRIDVYI